MSHPLILACGVRHLQFAARVAKSLNHPFIVSFLPNTKPWMDPWAQSGKVASSESGSLLISLQASRRNALG